MASVTDYLTTFLPIWDATSHDPAATQRGAALLAAGAIMPDAQGWRVKDDHNVYRVHYTPPPYLCNCTRSDCAHVAAVALMVQATLLVARARYGGNLLDLQAHIGRELPTSRGHRRHLLRALWAASDRERRHAEQMKQRAARRQPSPTRLSRTQERQLAAEARLAATSPKRELHQAGYRVQQCVLCRTQYARRTKIWAKFLCPRCHSPAMLTEMRRVRCHNRQASERRHGSGVCFLHWIAALDAFGWGCAYCGRAGEITLDHFIPQAVGGVTCKTNVVPACERCNVTKGHTLPHELPFPRRRVWRVAVYLGSQADEQPWPPRTGPARPTDQASGQLTGEALAAWLGA